MKDIIKISTVNFHPEWGCKEENLNRMLGIIEACAAEGANLIVFPEMALTGYDEELTEVPFKEKMQYKNAETVPGASSNKVAELTKKLKVYTVFGMPELDKEDKNVIYNSACVCGPEGVIGSYQKIHLPYPEFHWATRGKTPFMFDTPWGPVGVAICYDSYQFPELTRYYAAKGCRINLNCTAYAKCHGDQIARLTMEAYASINEMFIVSSNLVGVDLSNDFWGGSSIVGPDTTPYSFTYYAGYPFAAKEGMKADIYTASIDLGLARRGMFEPNKDVNDTTDYRPVLYSAWMTKVLEDSKYCE